MPSRLWIGMSAGEIEYVKLQRCCRKQGLQKCPIPRDLSGPCCTCATWCVLYCAEAVAQRVWPSLLLQMTLTAKVWLCR